MKIQSTKAQTHICLLIRPAPNVRRHDRHAVGGESARLVGADRGGVAHGLAGVQVSHQVVVLHHFLREEGGLTGLVGWLLMKVVFRCVGFMILIYNHR